MELIDIKQKIRKAVDKLYGNDQFLFTPFGKDSGLCERCINHRFAVYLEQQNFGKDYFIDCEYNKSHFYENTGVKKVSNPKGNYIDIVITKRDGNYKNDLTCFEVKKYNNYKDRKKDRENLKILTDGIRFGYDYGVYVIFGKTKEKIKIEIYKSAEILENGGYDLLLS